MSYQQRRVVSIRSTFRIYFHCWLFALCSLGAKAQTAPKLPTCSITGRITDSTGALIPGARVELQTINGDAGPSTTTDSAGRYIFTNADPGPRIVVASATGFASFRSQSITLASGTSRTLDIHLAIADQVQQIDVPSNNAMDTDPNNNGDAFVLNGRALDDLPVEPGALSQELNALAGSDTPELRIDGFSGGTMPPKSSIREIHINQNPYSAQNDTNPVNGMIEVFTKPGTGELHGQLYVYADHSAFNSLSRFVTEAPDYDTVSGFGSISGPITKRTSFFFNGTRNEWDTDSVINAQILDANNLPISFRQAIATPSVYSNYSTRIDTGIGKKSTLIFRYVWSGKNQTNAGVRDLSLLSQGYSTFSNTQILQISNSQILTSKIINDTRFEYLRDRQSQSPNSSAPSIVVQGAFNQGGSNTGNYRDNQDRYELQNYVSASEGKHFLTFGGRLRSARDANRSQANYNGQFVFANLTIPTDLGATPLSSVSSYQFTLQNLNNCNQHLSTCITDPKLIRTAGGGPSQFTITTGNPNVVVSLTDVGLFFQDDWKVNTNFTLSAGLRFESQNRISDHADWAPRLGFAYGFGGKKDKPQVYTLRGGTGIFYKRFASANVLQAQRQNGILQQQYVVTSPIDFTNPPSIPDIKTIGTALPSSTFQVSPSFRSPYFISNTISLQRSIGNLGQITGTYLYNRGVHSQLTRNINAPLPGTYNPADPSSGVRPLGTRQDVYEYESAGLYKTNRLSTNLFLHYKTFVSIFGYYMLRFDKTDVGGGFPSDQYNIAADYGRSPADVRHSLVLGANFTLPWKIQPGLFLSTASGAPFNIVVGQDLNGDSQFNDRPTFATDLSRASVVRTPYGNFDTNPIAGQTRIPYNYGQGPSLFQLNARLGKSFDFGPRAKPPAGAPPPKIAPGAKAPPIERKYHVSFYLYSENVLNNVNLAPPVGTLTSPLFGKSIALYGNDASSSNRAITMDMSFQF